jgi:hypothetical protein
MDLLRLNDLTSSNLHKLIDRAVEMEHEYRAGTLRPTLAGKRIALIVDDSGWRNTTALDLGMRLLNATCVHVPASLGGKEEIEDLAKYLDNWFDLIAIRTPSLAKMTELADRASCPIVNLRTRENHPCETLGDLSYVKARRKTSTIWLLRRSPPPPISFTRGRKLPKLCRYRSSKSTRANIGSREQAIRDHPSNRRKTWTHFAVQTSSSQTVGRMAVRRTHCCRSRSLRGCSIKQKRAACSSPARRSLEEKRCQPMR